MGSMWLYVLGSPFKAGFPVVKKSYVLYLMLEAVGLNEIKLIKGLFMVP